ncbi:uncharacterized protein LY89DRAFT_509737 [Mollisia scopiformis]|uniref:Uncharacterized protein n=1 Tax=Mollisia scopiformis TaxID=149040 RepID=A0A194XFT8_MOLSC|nr:uncharacterized protein LY89DRAFT_509737 [Mollisia scopiformis]KUJ19006.1 hypothetical protein LY89DRAFT_509737 [Mollisia scopiformis]
MRLHNLHAPKWSIIDDFWLAIDANTEETLTHSKFHVSSLLVLPFCVLSQVATLTSLYFAVMFPNLFPSRGCSVVLRMPTIIFIFAS